MNVPAVLTLPWLHLTNRAQGRRTITGGVLAACLYAVYATLALVVLLTGTWPAHAQAPAAQAAGAAGTPATERRLALVIGNARYAVSPLRNPVNDARVMEASLRDAGFEVMRADNVSRREMQRLIRDFGDRLKRDGGVGLFYFSGHGVQVKGANYLVPIDADIRAEDEVAFDSIDAQSVLEKMETAGNRVNLMILDACRNNPFASGARSASRGLAQMNAPSGTLVAYATAPGQVALDGSGTNSPYTRHLAAALAVPGLPVEEVFKQVRSAVRRETGNTQTPWENTALEGQFFFRPALATGSADPASATELSFWNSVKDARNASELAAYLDRFPNGVFAALARARMRDLVAPAVPGPQVAAASSASAPTSALSGARALGRLRLYQPLGNNTQWLDVVSSQAPDGALELSTGDVIAADGALRTVRLGDLVAQVTEGSLWSVPPKPDTRGRAVLRIAGQSQPGRVEWSTRTSGSGVSVLAELNYFAVTSAGSAHNIEASRRFGQWTGDYDRRSPVPLRFTMQTRNTTFGGVPDRIEGELTALAEAAAATRRWRLGVTDQLTRIEQMHDLVEAVAPDGSRSFGSDEAISASGQATRVRLGSTVGSVRSGGLWSFPLRDGDSGRATLGIEGHSQTGSIEWRVVPDSDGRARIEAQVRLPIIGNVAQAHRAGTWTALMQRDFPVPLQTRLDTRPMVMGGGMNPEATATRLLGEDGRPATGVAINR